LTATALLAGPIACWADQPRQLDDAELRSEMRMNRLLAAYIDRNGMPDLAERSFLADMPPWDDHQVTLYYLDRHKQISFARAYILGWPSIAVAKSEHTLSDAQVAALKPRARCRATVRGGALARAEAAAERAEAAAARVEAAADGADRAAARAESIVSKMESEPARPAVHRRARKR
jgi:hypothetical protein